jgi:hypothetical protein
MTQLTPKTENIADAKESGHVARPEPCKVQGSHAPNVVHGGFEPEILAFCCEH